MEPSRPGAAPACRVVARPLPQLPTAQLALQAIDECVEAVDVVGHEIEEPEGRALGVDADDERQDVDRRAPIRRRELQLGGLARPESAAHAHFHARGRDLRARAVQRSVRGGDPHSQLERGARRGSALHRVLGALFSGQREGSEVRQDLTQPLERHGLADEVQGAELETRAGLYFGGDARDDDHRHLGVAHDRQAEELDPAHTREPDVEQDGVRSGARQRLEPGFRAPDDDGLIAELGDEVPEDLGQPLVVLDDQDPHGVHGAATPQKTGSGVRRRPKRFSTAVCTRQAKATTSRARAPSRATMARACRVETPTGPSARPRAYPARSINHAAESFTRPSGRTQRGIVASPARDSTAARSGPGMMGFVKNEPQLRRFSSWGSSTIDLDRRMAITLARTSPSDGVAMPREARSFSTSAYRTVAGPWGRNR